MSEVNIKIPKARGEFQIRKWKDGELIYDSGTMNNIVVNNFYKTWFDHYTNFNQNLSTWNVSNVINMNSMFSNCTNFNSNLSGWCVTNITSEPSGFSVGSLLTSENKPVWGTCP